MIILVISTRDLNGPSFRKCRYIVLCVVLNSTNESEKRRRPGEQSNYGVSNSFSTWFYVTWDKDI